MEDRNLTVQIGARVHPLVDDRIEAVARKFQIEKSEIIRRSLDLGLRRFERARHLPAVVKEEGGSE